MQIRPWILAARPKTLPAALAPVILGSALAYADGAFRAMPAALALGFALLIQIGTNYANDYFDYVKGADTQERQGPARAVASGMLSPRTMLAGTLVCFAIAFAEGLCLLPYGGWPLAIVGLFCVLMGLAYTGGPFPLAYNGTADFFVLLFFGVVAVCMTYYVQAGAFTSDVFLLSLAPGALATNILVVNNYRDMETDRAANKRTLVVRFGRGFGAGEYLAMLAVAHLVPIALCLRGRGLAVLLPLLSLPLAFRLYGMMRRADSRAAFDKALGGTALYMIVYSLLMSVGLLA
ncbi:MAG: 1,4-dihydroxy-2-naphthoate polyprenyltransferase [Opitutales bacterium]|nr:1,4-dihydroxy-2-naphthoate polyprenyltransferase [Opitutales bacterium]